MLLPVKYLNLKTNVFFDHRLRKIYELKSLDSLFNELDLIESSDAIYFTSLNDFWINFNETRQSGSEIGFNISPGSNFNWQKDIHKISPNNLTDEITSDYSSKYIGGVFYFNNYKPIGLEWQRFLRFNTHLSKSFSNYSSSDYDSQNVSFSINYIYGYSWYINTRTKFSIDLQGRYSNSTSKYDNNYDDNKFESFNQYLHASLYYYISPQLRFSFNTDIQYSDYNYSQSEDYEKLLFSSNIGFTYMIF